MIVLGIQGHADTRADANRLPVDLDRPMDGIKQSIQTAGTFFRHLHANQKYDEFIPAQTSHGVIFPNGILDTAGDLDQHLVTCIMAKVIVHGFETI